MLRLAVVAAGAAAAAAQNSCKFQYKVASTGAIGATYDVSQLYTQTADWTWSDSVNNQTLMYQYTFQVCGNVNNPPQNCIGLHAPPAPAYQFTASSCQALAQPFPASPGITTHWMDLIDPADPAGGFKLVYGPPATAAGVCVPGFQINFRCGYEAFPQPNNVGGSIANVVANATVLEVNTCAYEAYSWSQAGCPQECPVTSAGLCSNRGICGYDTQLMKARCFCDDGYVSADCSAPSNSFPSGAVAGAVFGGIILGAGSLFGYGFYASRKAASTSTVDGFYA